MKQILIDFALFIFIIAALTLPSAFI